jgi:hypothetical protein
MSHEEHGHAPVGDPFSPEAIAALHEDDKKAAKSVVVLMVGVFLCGVVLYSIVAWSVAG